MRITNASNTLFPLERARKVRDNFRNVLERTVRHVRGIFLSVLGHSRLYRTESRNGACDGVSRPTACAFFFPSPFECIKHKVAAENVACTYGGSSGRLQHCIYKCLSIFPRSKLYAIKSHIRYARARMKDSYIQTNSPPDATLFSPRRDNPGQFSLTSMCSDAESRARRV